MNRRGLMLGFGALLAAPAIVRAESLMKIAQLRATIEPSMAMFGGYVFYLASDGLYMFDTANGISRLEPPQTWKFA